MPTKTASKEKHTGLWVPEGREVRFSREWSGVRFDDEQCEQLLAGGIIEFEAVSQAGNPYRVKGQLAQQVFQAHDGRTVKFVGFMPDFSRPGDPNEPPGSWCGHEFTEAELEALRSGRGVYAEDFISVRTQKLFSCDVYFRDVEGTKRIVPEFSSDKED